MHYICIYVATLKEAIIQQTNPVPPNAHQNFLRFQLIVQTPDYIKLISKMQQQINSIEHN